MAELKELEGMNLRYYEVCKKSIKTLIAKEYIGKASVLADFMKKDIPDITVPKIKNLMAGSKVWDEECFDAFQKVVYMFDKGEWHWLINHIWPNVLTTLKDQLLP